MVRLPNADHNVLRSNEADVLREMKLFNQYVKEHGRSAGYDYFKNNGKPVG